MFAKLVSFVLILIGLWSLFRFVGRFDVAKKNGGRSAGSGSAGKSRGGSRRQRGGQGDQRNTVVEAEPMVQCRKCQVFHEAGKRCPDCYPKG
jgi:hypothetical protein